MAQEPEEADAAIVTRVVGGEQQAYGLLVQRYQRRLRSVLSFYCLSADEVEEFVQDAFVQAFAHLASYRPESPFFPWLKTIALNALRMEIRRRETEGRHGRAYLQYLLAQRMDEDEAGDAAEARAGALKECLSGLRPEHARLLAARYHDGHGVEELARREQVELSAMKVRLFRIREVLRECIERHLGPAVHPAEGT
jgi:RNA polymerase sigma-70 factor (ECF subfamily)